MLSSGCPHRSAHTQHVHTEEIGRTHTLGAGRARGASARGRRGYILACARRCTGRVARTGPRDSACRPCSPGPTANRTPLPAACWRGQTRRTRHRTSRLGAGPQARACGRVRGRSSCTHDTSSSRLAGWRGLARAGGFEHLAGGEEPCPGGLAAGHGPESGSSSTSGTCEEQGPRHCASVARRETRREGWGAPASHAGRASYSTPSFIRRPSLSEVRAPKFVHHKKNSISGAHHVRPSGDVVAGPPGVE